MPSQVTLTRIPLTLPAKISRSLECALPSNPSPGEEGIMAKCDKCMSKPEMTVVSRSKMIETGNTGQAVQRFRMTQHLRATGHPAIALAASALSGAAWVANQFFEEVRFKCPICGDTKSETQKKS